ncbi:MAG: hypothetical protein IIY20_05990 [Bifidobacteriaceae bacterium]|nr:hypothetical protein [Bifidobacteriaceae bacterium]
MLGTAEQISAHTAAAIPATIKIKTAIPAAEGEGKTGFSGEKLPGSSSIQLIPETSRGPGFVFIAAKSSLKDAFFIAFFISFFLFYIIIILFFWKKVNREKINKV